MNCKVSRPCAQRIQLPSRSSMSCKFQKNQKIKNKHLHWLELGSPPACSRLQLCLCSAESQAKSPSLRCLRIWELVTCDNKRSLAVVQLLHTNILKIEALRLHWASFTYEISVVIIIQVVKSCKSYHLPIDWRFTSWMILGPFWQRLAHAGRKHDPNSCWESMGKRYTDTKATIDADSEAWGLSCHFFCNGFSEVWVVRPDEVLVSL